MPDLNHGGETTRPATPVLEPLDLKVLFIGQAPALSSQGHAVPTQPEGAVAGGERDDGTVISICEREELLERTLALRALAFGLIDTIT